MSSARWHHALDILSTTGPLLETFQHSRTTCSTRQYCALDLFNSEQCLGPFQHGRVAPWIFLLQSNDASEPVKIRLHQHDRIKTWTSSARSHHTLDILNTTGPLLERFQHSRSTPTSKPRKTFIASFDCSEKVQGIFDCAENVQVGVLPQRR